MGDAPVRVDSRKVGETDNLTELENLNEASLLAELQVRYKRDCIYTYVGEILVAVNPFKHIKGLYDGVQAKKYTNVGDRSSQPPHVFAAADAAFSAMTQNPPGVKANQVCVISGESGAGKTESAKLFIKQIIGLSTGSTSHEVADGEKRQAKGLEEKIIQLNPLLEAFGNAQTLRNDNSSRFGKFIELRFDDAHHIQGALMYEYLLEKSRVIQQSEGERNFHVFYLLFSGLTDETRTRWQLADPRDHRFINGNDTAVGEIGGQRYKEMSEELEECMSIVGFSDREIEELHAILAGVLHIGDVTFSGDEQASIENPAGSLAKACHQLGVDAGEMELGLTQAISMARSEVIVKNYKPSEAGDVRDATAKGIYGRLFTWIVGRANALLGPKTKQLGPKDKKIGILDIFGFECFQTNSFEQLLINLANEQLQFFFNNHIFKMELDEYAREGIDGSQITYEDNQALLDMLLSKNPLGILSTVDEEAAFPKGTDSSMVEKLKMNIPKGFPKGFEPARGNEDIFSVIHYAGKVTYTALGFLEKNRDTLSAAVIGAMLDSTKELVFEIFSGDSGEDPAKVKKDKEKAKKDAKKDAKKSLRKSAAKIAASLAKAKKTSVATQFKTQLAELMSEMSVAQPHFIRTIKPNELKVPNKFDEDLVTKQLRYCGMLETTRIRKEGYAFRPSFSDFMARYKIIGFRFTSNPPANEASCRKICEKASIKGLQVGKTKVFLRYFHVDELNLKLRPYPTAAAKIQRIVRGFVARRRLVKLKKEAEKYRTLLGPFLTKIERNTEALQAVLATINEEDAQRPPEYFIKKPKKDKVADKYAVKKVPKGGDAGAMQRAASVRWYKEVELKKGAGVKSGGDKSDTSGFQEWFHGIITRKQAEGLLSDKEPGTFLVRVSESRFGYSLSHVVGANSRLKHYMIEQNPDGMYQVIGNPKLFPSLNDLVNYHSSHKIVTSDPVCLLFPCGQIDGESDDREELLDKKKKGKK